MHQYTSSNTSTLWAESQNMPRIPRVQQDGGGGGILNRSKAPVNPSFKQAFFGRLVCCEERAAAHCSGVKWDAEKPFYSSRQQAFEWIAETLLRFCIVGLALCLAGSRAIGSIIGPVIGGLLAQPAVIYPSKFSSTGLFARYRS